MKPTSSEPQMADIVNTSALSGLVWTTTTESGTLPLESFLLYQASRWIWKVVAPVILSFGTFGNIMTLVILWRLQTGWSSMNLYLRILALFDLSVLYLNLLVKWLDIVWGYNVRGTHSAVCKVLVWFVNTCAVFSSWLLVALTIERSASVMWPHRVHVICTRRLSVITIVILFIVISLFYSHYMYGFDLVTSGGITFCSMGSKSYKTFMDTVFLQISTIIGSLLPFACLITSNGIIIFKLIQSVKATKDKLASAPSSSIDKRKTKTSAASVTLVLVSAAFIILKIPLQVKNMIFSLYNTNVVVALESDYIALRHFVNAFTYMMIYLNYAINFYLYCLTGARFRNEFKRMVCLCWSESTSHTANINVEAHKKVRNERYTGNDDF